MPVKTVYHNRLPHLAPVGATFFITFRLADSLPQSVFQEIYEEYECKKRKLLSQGNSKPDLQIRQLKSQLFGKYEAQLDHEPFGSCHLQKPEVAQILIDRLKQFDGSLYELQTYCIMPNHVHMLIGTWPQVTDEKGFLLEYAPSDYVQLHQIMKWIKGGSAYWINQQLGRKGTLWAKDSFDRYIRTEAEWARTATYILDNPVKAGLVKQSEDWPFSYLKSTGDRISGD